MNIKKYGIPGRNGNAVRGINKMEYHAKGAYELTL